MAKSATKSRSPEDGGTVEQMAEPERLAAITKVRLAYEGLATLPDRSEASLRRVKLLQVWRDLVAMREVEPSVPTQDAVEAESSDPFHADPVHETVAVTSDAPVQTDVHHEPIEESPSPVIRSDLSIEEVHPLVSHREPDVVIPDLVLSSHSEELVIADDSKALTERVDVVIAEAPPLHDTKIDILRIRLRLIKPGLVHDMLLPEGTIVSVFPADAEDLVNQGTAEILLIQEDSDDD